MAITGATGTSNMRRKFDHVNPDCKRQEFWRNREVGWSSGVMARLTQFGGLTRAEAIALLAALERGDFTPKQVLKGSIPRDENDIAIAGMKPTTNKNAVGFMIQKLGEDGLGLIRTLQKPDHSRRIPGVYEPTPALFSYFQIPIRAYKRLSTSTQRSVSPEQYVQRPAPPEAQYKPGAAPPPKKVQQLRSAPAACRKGGEPSARNQEVTEEIKTIAGRIKALAGDDLAFRPDALLGMLRKQRRTLADLETALEDVAVVLPVRRQARPDAKEWLMLIGYLGNEAMRLGIADQAQKIRASAQRQTSAAAQPKADAATWLAQKFGITADLGAKILPEVLADPAKAAKLVELGLAKNTRSANPIHVPAIYALRALTMQPKWAEIRDSAEAQALLAGRSEALRTVIRAGWIRCEAHEIPAAVLSHLEAWAALQVTMPPPDAAGHLDAHEAERQARAAVLAAAVEALGSQVAALSEALRQRLSGHGITEGGFVWKQAWRAHWADMVAGQIPWMPVLRDVATERIAA